MCGICFFKQKTAYEMRISDWSSDVCSSDLGDQYPIEWVYRRRGLPVEVVAEFDNWRRVRAPDRTEGWMHRALLSLERTIVVQGETRTLHAEAATWAPPVARLAPGVIVQVATCEGGWGRGSVAGRRGWRRRAEERVEGREGGGQ